MPSNLSKVDDAHKRREMFIEVHGKVRLMEIKLLHEIWSNKDWDKLGFQSFKDYFEAPRDSGGLDISRSWANELILTYQKYIKELGLPERLLGEVSLRKLYHLKNKVTKENVEEMIEKAKTLSMPDIILEEDKVDTTNCKHEEIDFMTVCKHCKQWTKYTNIDDLEELRGMIGLEIKRRSQ
jgi:hypothetical protein